MRLRPLGRTGLEVSVAGLGTMTWGQQNTEADALAQTEYALSQGVNFVDTAEMYPVPPMAKTQGRTEEFVGSVLKKLRARDDVILATKFTGPADMPWIRGGPRTSRSQILKAVEGSLKRLQTDRIDLYQVHWPDRKTNFFGKLGYTAAEDGDAVPIEETLEALAGLVKSGKVRHVGVSNETPWGVMQYLQLARDRGWPRIASIQNPYNLLNRSFEIGLAEFAHREEIGLIAYSPLAFGVLSGKYLDGARPPAGRLTLFSRFQRYTGAGAEAAVRDYVSLARAHGLDPAQMALAYACSRPFTASTLVGATTMEQLRANLAAAHLSLSADVLEGIETIHRRCTNPCP